MNSYSLLIVHQSLPLNLTAVVAEHFELEDSPAISDDEFVQELRMNPHPTLALIVELERDTCRIRETIGSHPSLQVVAIGLTDWLQGINDLWIDSLAPGASRELDRFLSSLPQRPREFSQR